ncbi:PREDICTED: transmembrane protein 237-like [Priapulus caudatus]|uniref:Transmembrane protein 237-like n=1 Tax=Priapulus caudatus TaxID=37621 RepID=A0ABM1EIP1_PRICU|nr:PREDICTED: transmembrane protein 237-like [Priapulus caudatus]
MASARPLPSLPPRNLPPIFKEDEVNPSKPRHGKAKRKPKKAASTTEKSDVVKTNETRVAVPDVDGVGKKSHKKKKPTSDNTTRHLLTDNLSPDESEVDRRVPESVSTKKPKAGSTAKKLIAKMSTAQENTAFDNKADDESEAPQRKKKKRKKDKLVVDTYGQDEAMDITVLSDDVVTSEDEEEVGERLERSHVAAAQPRQHLGKLFVENERGFQMRDWTQHENRPQALDLVPLGVDLPSSTPQDLAVYTQKVFRTFAVFAHGLLAGFALWQCIVIYTLQERSSSYEDFVDHYCNVALPTNSLYYVLLIVSTVSVFDRRRRKRWTGGAL